MRRIHLAGMILSMTMVLALSACTSPKEDPIEALRAAAEAGDMESQLSLGVMCDHGEGLPEDDLLAMHWYKLAAEQGSAAAQVNLGVLYDRGGAIPEDNATAVRWFGKAAEQGYVLAYFALGVMYGTGEGVPEDFQMAYVFFNMAAAGGNQKASKWRDMFAARLTADQLAEGQQMARKSYSALVGT
jgi:TPR repeat protein